jgi:peptidyl-prolyl cis-trans isomerase D
MLKSLRKHSRSWFIALAIGAIVVVFIFWGVGSLQSPRFQEAAEVNGTPILLTAYIRQFNEMAKQYRDSAQGELTEETIKQMRLKEMALNRLIDETLLLQAATRLGLTVSDAELRQVIQSYPFFQKDGKFNEQQYNFLLSRNHLNPSDFEQEERQRLLLKKVLDEVGSFAKVSDLELEEYYRLSKEAVEVKYLEFTPQPYLAKQNPGDAEVARYYQDHQALFRVPAKARVNYLVFRSKDFLDRVNVSTAEQLKYLNEHQQEFSRPKVIQVRQLFLALPAKGEAAARQAVEKQAQDLFNQAMQGGDFAQLAKSHSQDLATKDKGGDLGEVSRGQHPPEWDKAAFGLTPGTVGQAVTPQGIYLIKMDGIKESEQIPDAAAQVDKLLKTEKAKAMAQEAAQQSREEWPRSAVPEAAKKYGVTPKETSLIARQEPVPGLGVVPNFNTTALELKPKEISKVIDVPEGFAVLQGVEHQPEHVPTLEQVKAKVREALKKEMAQKQAEKEAARLLEQLRQGKTLAQVAAEAGLPIKDSGYFTRFQGFLGQPSKGEATVAAFLLSGQKPYPAHPLSVRDNYYIIAFKGRRSPDQAEMTKELDKLRERFLQQKQQMMFASWLDAERKQAKIKIYQLP